MIQKIYFDTEFTQLHKNTTLISIGLVDDNGRSFYAEFTDYDKSQVNDWLKENVMKNMLWANNDSIVSIVSEDKKNIKLKNRFFIIAHALCDWLNYYENHTIQFVSDCCHYDFVLLIDLLARANKIEENAIYTVFDIPKNISPVCEDLNDLIAKSMDIPACEAFDVSRETLAKYYVPNLNIESQTHNSLYDANIIRIIYKNLCMNEGRNTMYETEAI